MSLYPFLPVLRLKISGDSMLPAFKNGQEVIGFCWFSKLHTGDVIIVSDPRDGKLLLKRINKIRDNSYFVLGDNPDKSTDSRQFGWIKRKDIQAIVKPLSK